MPTTPVYNFKTIAEFVAYLDTRAQELRVRQSKQHNRTHLHAALERGAAEIESIASIVKASNLGTVDPLPVLKGMQP